MIFKRLKKIVAHCFKVNEKKIALDVSFEQNRDFIIGCPYFSIKKLAEAVKDEFGLEIPIEKFFKEKPKIKTVGDLLKYIYENQKRE